MILVDSNVWAYFLDTATPEHAQVKRRLPKLLGNEPLLMPAIVQIEVGHYVVRRMGRDASGVIETFFSQEAEIEPLTGGAAAEAARFLMAHRDAGIGARDAALLLAARRHGATLVTHDRPLAKLAGQLGLDVRDPAL